MGLEKGQLADLALSFRTIFELFKGDSPGFNGLGYTGCLSP